MSEPVKISVVTPTLNAARYLPLCVESVRRQVGSGFTVEHVVVDGGSTDETVAIARAHGCRVLEGKDAGLYDALDRGIDAAEGDVFGCLGGDDVLMPAAAAAIADWYRGGRSKWMVGALEWIDPAGQSLGTLRAPPARLPVAAFASLGWSCLAHPATYMTRGLYRELGGFDTSLRISADYLLLARALQRMPFDRVATVIAGFRRHESSLSLRGDALAARENALVAERFAPASPVLRASLRALLKLYLNAANPAWALRKRGIGLGARNADGPEVGKDSWAA